MRHYISYITVLIRNTWNMYDYDLDIILHSGMCLNV